MTRGKLLQRILERFEECGYVWPHSGDVAIERLYPGHWQRDAGAWSWRLIRPSGEFQLYSWASEDPATKVAQAENVAVRHNKLDFYLEIDAGRTEGEKD